MSRHASELCSLLLEDIYGELTARVFSLLLRNGRLQLSLLIHHTGLSSRQIKHSLAVLIQQHLVYHYRPPDGDATFYEADWKNAYALVRPGKIINLVEERYGKAASGVVSNLLLLGHARVDDLAAAYNLDTGRVDGPLDEGGPYANPRGLPNGVRKAKLNNTAKASVFTLESLHTTIHNLLQAGILTQVHATHFRSAADNRNEAERVVQRYAEFVGGPKGTKQKAAFEAAVQKQLQTWQSGDVPGTEFANGVSASRKRRMGSFAPSSAQKRTKLGSSSAYAQNGSTNNDDIMLDDNLVLRTNHEKLNVAFRNHRLVEFAEHCIGKTTSLVYAEVLRCLEGQIPRCRPDQTISVTTDDETENLPTFTTSELSSLLRSKDLDFMGAIGREKQIKLTPNHSQNAKKGRLKHEDGDSRTANDYSSLDEDDDEDVHDDNIDTNGSKPGFRYADANSSALEGEDDDDDSLLSNHGSSMSSIKQHLHLLAEDEHEFVRLTEKDNGLVEWSVDFSHLSRQLRQYELERTITARFGTVATRIVRIFLDKGKLDEKQISNFALIHQKRMRAALTVMHEAGHLELQEVPRDNNRQPSRTMFLWYFDPERCRQLVLEQTYKAMARCLQRAKVERLAIQTLIDKAERTDVVGNEDQYLSVEERVVLSRWREKEERILGEVGRLDDLVGVLRDY